jgi:PAS domain S-box-containing protein
VSPAVTDVLGWTPEEFTSRPFMDFVHPDDAAKTRQEVERQMKSGERVLHFENRYRHKDGSWRVLSWRSMPEGGLMYATARDVTDSVEQLAAANESLRKSERRFRALIEHGADSIALIDADNRILYLSPAVANVEGYAPEELLGHTGMEHTHPDDLPVLAQTMEQMLANPGKPVPAVWRRRHKEGHWIWLEGVATNLLGDPSVGAIVCNYRDITGRLAHERRLGEQLQRLALLSRITRAIGERQDLRSIFQVVVRSLEDELPVDFCSICLYDAAQNQLSVSCVSLSSEPLAQRIGLVQETVVPIDENGLGRCITGHLVYEADIAASGFEFPRKLAGAGMRSLVIAPLLVESQVFGVLVCARHAADAFSSGECEFLRQVSEHTALASHQAQLYGALQRAYDDLRQTQQQVMQQERLRALGQMASGIAHDINNAISPMSLYAESLLERETSLSEAGRRQLETIQRAVDDVAQTVARMGEFYRLREPRASLVPVDLNLLTEHVVDLTRARWSDMALQRGVVIEVTTDLAPNLPAVQGVEAETREALVNLILNAVDAMPDGGTVTLKTDVQRAPDGQIKQVRVDVVDTGLGMSEETRRRCLEPFYTTKGERGTGLGLAMVYGVAQRQGAEVDIASELGAGTTVSLVFPAASVAEKGVVQKEALVAAPTRLRLLLIDDDAMVLTALKTALALDGHDIEVAEGGQSGIDAFTTATKAGKSFSAVITDLGMPHVDGGKVAAAVKALSPKTPVILLTGWGQGAVSADDTANPSVDAVLGKPARVKDLRATLARVVGEPVAKAS